MLSNLLLVLDGMLPHGGGEVVGLEEKNIVDAELLDLFHFEVGFHEVPSSLCYFLTRMPKFLSSF